MYMTVSICHCFLLRMVMFSEEAMTMSVHTAKVSPAQDAHMESQSARIDSAVSTNYICPGTETKDSI